MKEREKERGKERGNETFVSIPWTIPILMR